MSIFRRIWEWIRSLFGGKKKNEFAEFERYVKSVQEALRSMKAKTEAVLVEQDRRNREIAQCRSDIDKMSRYAEKAQQKGSADAAYFLDKRDSLIRRLNELEQASEAAAGYTNQAEALYEQAERELQELAARKDTIQAKVMAAELQESIHALENGQAAEAMRARAQEAQRAADKAEAMAELDGRSSHGSELDELMKKYDQSDHPAREPESRQAGAAR